MHAHNNDPITYFHIWSIHKVSFQNRAFKLVTVEAFNIPSSKVHGTNMGPIRGLQDPDGPHVGPMNFAIWDTYTIHTSHLFYDNL